MKNKIYKIIYIIGVIALVIGTIDPLEGSVIIAGGSIFISIASYLLKDSYRKLFLIFSILIVIGVAVLFYISYLGGVGGNSSLSPYWTICILPYPAGWLASIILLILKTIKTKKINNHSKNPRS